MKIENNILKRVKDDDIVNGTIIIPDNITEISEDAFMDCLNLTNIVIPDNVKVIGRQAFMDCLNLKSVTLPNGLTDINTSTFRNCSNLTSIEIPDSVRNIGPCAFYECTHLKKVKLSSNLEQIDMEAFYKCTSLANIDLPESLKSIGIASFKECKNLRSIVIPSQITKIPKDAFYFCHYMKQVTLPEGLTEIGDHSFFLCTALKHITLPNSLKEIERGAFKACRVLKEITIPENVFRIGSETFDDCEYLSKVTLPKNIKYIGDNCFSGCYSLKSIYLPDSLNNIGKGLFRFCMFLQNVRLPQNMSAIPEQMFYRCLYLRKIDIPETVTEIGIDAFNTCKHLKFINLPEGLQKIDGGAFEGCKSLPEANLPSSLNFIGSLAFRGCSKLKEFNLPNGIETLNLNFIKDCPKIKSIYIPNTIKSFQNPNDSYFSFVEKSNDGFIVLNQPAKDSYLIDSIKIRIPFFFKYKDLNPNLINEQKNEAIADFYDSFAEKLTDEQLESFMKNHNFTFFKQIMKLKPKSYNFNNVGFYTGYYNLGGFNPISEYNGKKIDYAQKVTGKLLEYIDKAPHFRPYDKLSIAFESMAIDGFKKEFTDFYLDKIFDIMQENYYNEEFVSRAYNEFEEIQATNTNNRGSQRQLKPTIEKFKSYFDANKFRNITPETKPIAMTISIYFDKQEHFDRAVDIMEEFKINKTPTNILSKPLNQENSPFEYIDEKADQIKELQTEMLGNLAQTATSQYSYEWLEKNDPTNLILGKLCSCCAHLHGAGYGIMHASIIHPNVQNLVIRNEEGRIIAKSTLFINPEEQFGVLNNFEVYQGVPYLQYKETYQRFMQGISDFAKQYNIEHPENPLKQINVGAMHNDLLNYVSSLNEKSPTLLKAIDYADFGYDILNYNGDSFETQYIVWKNDELQEKEKTTQIEESEKES